MKSFLFTLIAIFTSLSAHSYEVLESKTLKEWKGEEAEKIFNNIAVKRFEKTKFTNSFGEVLAESRKVTYGKTMISKDSDGGIFTHKIRNCWVTIGSKFECREDLQKVQYWSDNR